MILCPEELKIKKFFESRKCMLVSQEFFKKNYFFLLLSKVVIKKPMGRK